VAASNVVAPYSPEIPLASANDFDWDSFLNHTMTSSLPYQADGPNSSVVAEETTLWTDMFLGDPNIDWIGLGDTLFV
jgi:hypothetical protein